MVPCRSDIAKFLAALFSSIPLIQVCVLCVHVPLNFSSLKSTISDTSGPVERSVNGIPTVASARSTNVFTFCVSSSKSLTPFTVGSSLSRPVTAIWVAPLIIAEYFAILWSHSPMRLALPVTVPNSSILSLLASSSLIWVLNGPSPTRVGNAFAKTTIVSSI